MAKPPSWGSMPVMRCSLSVQAAGPRRRRSVSRRDRSGGTRPLRRFHERCHRASPVVSSWSQLSRIGIAAGFAGATRASGCAASAEPVPSGAHRGARGTGGARGARGASLSDKGSEDPEQIVIIDDGGTFIGYGNRRRVVASKGKAASRRQREEREWISVLAGGTAGGTQLPPTYLLRGGSVLGDLREHGYVIRCSKVFNTQDGFREYVTHWQCTMCRPSSDAGTASEGEYSQTYVSGSDSA